MAVAIKEDGPNVCLCILQLNHSESEGVCVHCLSSFNKLQTRFPKEPGVGGLFVVQGEIRYIYKSFSNHKTRDLPSHIRGRC